MDASGGFGGTMVFGKWKGRNVVRNLVTPSNPNSTGQEESRNAIRVMGAGQHFANVTTQKRSGETVTDKQELISLAPSGQAWNGFLVKSGIGAGQLNYDAAETAYTALTSLEKGAWDTAAAALVPAIPPVNQTEEGGMPDTPMPAGQVFFHYVYALYVAGAAPAPTGTPPTYA